MSTDQAPDEVFLQDQLAAAEHEAEDVVISRVQDGHSCYAVSAALDQTAAGRVLARVVFLLEWNDVETCPHTTSPVPLVVAAWHPSVVSCRACLEFAPIPSVTEVRHCNACGQPATSEDAAVGQLGPLLVLMVLCDTCAEETASLSA